MESFLKKGAIINLMSTMIFLAIGIVLWTNPTTTLAVITYVIEAVLIIAGILTIINYLRVESKDDVFSCGFVQGVVCILLALFLIANPKIIITILPIIIGIWMILGSLTRIQIAIKLSNLGKNLSSLYIFIAVLMFAIGLIVICNPFVMATIIVQMVGVAIVIYSAFDMIESLGILGHLSNHNKNK